LDELIDFKAQTDGTTNSVAAACGVEILGRLGYSWCIVNSAGHVGSGGTTIEGAGGRRLSA
jgi:hypothetical protein